MSKPRDSRDPVQQMAEVEAYLADVPDEMRSALEDLRATIRSVLPDATEMMGYGVPAFYVNGKPVVSYTASEQHCSLDVHSPAVTEAHADELASYEAAKGAVRFTPDEPLPDALVEKLVRARVEESS